MPDDSTPPPVSAAASRTRPPRLPAGLVRLAAALVLGLVGGWVGVMLAGTVHHEVGPLTTSMEVTPAWGGGTTVEVPPLGELRLDTHGGPLAVHARLVGVDVDEAKALFREPAQVDGLRDQAAQDLRWAAQMAALRALLAALVGGSALSLLALRRVRLALAGTATAGAAMVAAAAVAVATWNPAALAEPRYSGLLASAPTVVGDANEIVNDFSVYSDQLARIVENVTGLYAVSSNLPILPPEEDMVRVLHVSDLHLAPHAWDVVRTVAAKYRVDVVVDSGDITDHGSRPENRYLQEIRHLRVPYVWVRGNHDSSVTQRAMREIPNAVVLDGRVRTVEGLRFLGAGDPTFTPDKSVTATEEELAQRVADVADELAATAEEAGGVDMLVYHDPAPSEVFDGRTQIALSGHRHYRKVREADQGTWMMQQGSTGGSGLRALEPEEPARIQLSVLHIDRGSGELRAYDDISLGGLGRAQAQIDRQVVAPEESELVAPERRRSDPDAPKESPRSDG